MFITSQKNLIQLKNQFFKCLSDKMTKLKLQVISMRHIIGSLSDRAKNVHYFFEKLSKMLILNHLMLSSGELSWLNQLAYNLTHEISIGLK